MRNRSSRSGLNIKASPDSSVTTRSVPVLRLLMSVGIFSVTQLPDPQRLARWPESSRAPHRRTARVRSRFRVAAYGKTTPSVPTIDHFMQVSSKMCAAQAPREILMVTVDGPGSFDNEHTKKLVREQLFKAGVRLAAILNAVFQ